MPSRTPAANKINPNVMIPIKINSAGTTFSKKTEFLGICDLLV